MIEIRAQAADEAEVFVYDQIGEGFFTEGLTAKAFAEQLKDITASRITLRVNSPGGSVFDGLAIYNALVRHPAKVTTHIDGLAASIASVIALAGDRVVMADNALFMIHNPAAMVAGDSHEMRRVADLLDKVRDTMVSTYAARSALTDDELVAAMDAETWYTAAEAHEAGFADEVADSVPMAACAEFDLSAYRNPPKIVATTAVASTPREETTVENTTAVAPAAPEPVIRMEVPSGPTRMPSVGEYVVALGRKDAGALERFNRSIRAAAPDTLVADVDGLVPVPLLNEVINMRDAVAPVFNLLGPNAAPAGKGFRIPKITTHLTKAAAATELSDVTAQLVVGDVDVSMVFLKRAAEISYEAVEATQPGVVQVATQDLVDALLIGCEDYACTAIESATGTNAGVAITDDGSDAWTKLASAISVFYGATGRRPDAFVCPPDVWAALAGMTNSLGQPLINGVTQNLAGSWGTLFGLPVVVSYEFTAAEGYLISTYGVRSWATPGVSLQLSQPTTFAYQLGAGRNIGVSIADGKFITPVTVVPAVP